MDAPTGSVPTAIAQNCRLNKRPINSALKLVKLHEDEIREAWEAHFGS